MWFKGEQDYFLQTRLDLNSPNDIPMIYPQLMLSALLLNPNPERVLVIGLGGGHLPRVMSRFYPKTIVDTVEVDSQVVKLAKKYFLYMESSNCRTHVTDGRMFVQGEIGKTFYDIIWLDAFKSGSVPYHLKTWQFYEEIRKILKPGGVVSSNLYGQSNKLKPHDKETFLQVFRYYYGFEDPHRIATNIIATNREPQWKGAEFLYSAKKMKFKFPQPMSDIAAMYKPNLLEKESGFVFKDDFKQSQFEQAAKKNNLDGNQGCPYPITSLRLEEESG